MASPKVNKKALSHQIGLLAAEVMALRTDVAALSKPKPRKRILLPRRVRVGDRYHADDHNTMRRALAIHYACIAVLAFGLVTLALLTLN